MNKSIIIILLVTVLDAFGIGLIMPVLPTLLNEFVSENRLAQSLRYIISTLCDDAGDLRTYFRKIIR